MSAGLAEALLAVEDLATGYGRKQVVFGAALAVRPGEIVALIGHNGAGKTTTLKAVAGLLPVWAGQVRFDGVTIGQVSSAARVRLPTISGWNASGDTSGFSVRSTPMPTSAAAPIERQMKMMFSGLVPLTAKTATVAEHRASIVKNCHGRSVFASGVVCVEAKVLVEVFQLFIEPGLEHGVFARRRLRRRCRGGL